MAQKRTHPARQKPPGARRKPRADAQRNRERILEMAKQAFTRSGADASLDDIATQAGVGAGTLYRHFPTREALLAAVYRTEVEKLAAAEKRLAVELAPLEALRAWMLLFVDYIATKKIIAPALNAMVGEHSKVIEACYAQIQGAIRALVKRAIDGGEMRSDIDPVDLLKALVGVAYMSASPDWQQSARRLVDIFIAGPDPFDSSSRRNCRAVPVLDSAEGSVSNGAAFGPVLHKNNQKRRLHEANYFVVRCVVVGYGNVVTGADRGGGKSGHRSRETMAKRTADNNVALIEPLLADGFVNTDSEGKFADRAEMIAQAKATKYASVDYGDLKVKIFGSTGVATGTFKATGNDSSGKP